jgi:hypothetical protein
MLTGQRQWAPIKSSPGSAPFAVTFDPLKTSRNHATSGSESRIKFSIPIRLPAAKYFPSQ